MQAFCKELSERSNAFLDEVSKIAAPNMAPMAWQPMQPSAYVGGAEIQMGLQAGRMNGNVQRNSGGMLMAASTEKFDPKTMRRRGAVMALESAMK